MNLFEMEAIFETKMSQKQEEAPLTTKVDFKPEFDIIIERHGLNAPDALLQELSSLWNDPPPWSPWTK
ncbi:hypothetical protein fHeYen901_29 [Yersinia phage fHe-Yen9-01]|uniref:Molybdenum ABC transporter n=1 Tax=Yersinia phage fHe-Yen9-01 TaxID=1965363 RepID=A0A1V0DXC1_9CAUD|nr:hypothetical protein KNT60_gp028 [Yersinia phage fHe-Yen9-01]ARB05802.1 hypothetical protein fHeYen901_29 [Yersinia phage fHe-Yen9-01]